MVKRYPRKLVRAVGRYGNIQNYTLAGKIAYSGVAVIFLASTIIPTLQFIQDARAFRLSSAAQQLLDTPSQKLSNKFTYNQATKTYHFNEKEKAVEPAANPEAGPDPTAALKAQQTQITGKDGADKTLYSVDMPQQIEDGFTYYDNNLKISFKLIPEGQTGKGILKDDRLIYKLTDGTSAVFTAKNNGIKEDIILDKAPDTDDPVWRYKLDLPKTLEAKMLDNGDLGIYSADPSLFGNISYGSDADREKVMSARESGVKNYLVFGIPAPVIKETTNTTSPNARATPTAKFLLSADSKTLSVATGGLKAASYPISVDPSVVISSTTDFTYGNSEHNISFGSGQITGAGLSGATVSNFANTSSMNVDRTPMNGIAYNGYLYAVGDWGTDRTSIEYAPILSDGSVGAWTQQLNAMPENRYGFGVTVYNGYLYIVAGNNGTPQQNTYYTKINANGSVNTSWTLSPNLLTGGRYWLSATAYNGYLYASGGREEADGLDINSWNQVRKATINADGSISAWVAAQSMPTARTYHSMNAYNGYMYIAGGNYWDNSVLGAADPVYTNTIIYSKINADGSLGSWQTSISIGGGALHRDIFMHAGYLYFTSDTGLLRYAKIGPNGSLGTAASTFAPSSSLNSTGMVAYGNKIYKYGGGSDNVDTATTEYATIDSPGVTSSHTAGSTLATARLGTASVVNNGYIYAIGGHSGSVYLADVQKATLTASGTIGTWSSAGTALTTARAFAAATVYNGYLYVSGGLNNSGVPINDMQYIPFGAAGAITGSWSTATAPGTARYKHTMEAYNGYLYIAGGDSNTPPASTLLATTRIATLNLTNGNISSYANGTSFSTARRGMGFTAMGNKLYLAGGYDGTSVLADVQYATITPDTGAMSAWTTAGNSLATARSGLGLRAYNGCLYAAGGLTGNTGETSSAASVATNSVEYTCIDATNLPTTWSATTALTTARGYQGAAVVSGTLGVVGGAANGVIGVTPVNTTANATINHGGTGENGTTTAGTTFTTARYYHGTVAYDGYLYISGGFNINVAYNDVQKASISNGTIGTWTAQTTLPYVLYAHTMIAYNGHMYIIGGNGPTNNAVMEATIDPTTGNIGATWNTVSSLVGNHYGHGGAIYNGYLYVISGLNASQPNYSYNNNVEYTKINADGTLQPWATTTAFVGGRTNLVAVAVNGYLYAMGGVSGAITLNTPYREAYVAKINSDGTIGAWSQTASPPFNNAGNTLVAYNGYVSFMAQATGLLHRAVVLPNGQLGDWQTGSVAFGAANSGNGGMALYRGYAYVLPGSVGGTATNTSFSAPIESIERRGTYSKLIDLGSSRFLSSISYTGNLNDSLGDISYSTAASDGVLGTRLPANAVPPVGVIACISVPTVRYLWLNILLDDSKSNAIFPGSAQITRTTVEDVTITYEPPLRSPTENRLFQGKYFADNTLRPYDTCNN